MNRAEELAGALHTEALHISTSLIEELLSSLPVDAEGERKSTVEEAQVEERRLSATEECESDPLKPVSDVEREMDGETRLKILLKLLQLACAMVSLMNQSQGIVTILHALDSYGKCNLA